MGFQQYVKSLLISITLVHFSQFSFSQEKDSIKPYTPLKVTASLSINNKGISLFPNLTLGKPAAIINLSVGKKNIFFEPELRWGLNGKPWSYIYWLRYKAKPSKNFNFRIGAHPSYIMKEALVTVNGKEEKRNITTRYGAFEIAPTWIFSENFQLGTYYLYSKGLDSYATQNSNFFSIQPRFPNIKFSKNYYFQFFPQVFYLILDNNKGTYLSETLTLNKKNIPFGLTSIVTYKIKSTIPGDNWVWNVGLNIKF